MPRNCPLGLGVAEIQAGRRSIAQVFQVRPRTGAVWPDTASAPFRRINVSGSSPLSSTTTLTSKPSFTRSSHDSRGGPLPGGVRVEAEHDLRREPPEQLRLLGRQGRAAGRHDRRRFRLKDLGEIEISLDQHDVTRASGSRPSSGSVRRASGLSSKSPSPASSDTSGPGRRPWIGRRRRSTDPVSRQMGTISRLRNRSTIVAVVTLRRPARSEAAGPAQTPASAAAPSARHGVDGA